MKTLLIFAVCFLAGCHLMGCAAGVHLENTAPTNRASYNSGGHKFDTARLRIQAARARAERETQARGERAEARPVEGIRAEFHVLPESVEKAGAEAEPPQAAQRPGRLSPMRVAFVPMGGTCGPGRTLRIVNQTGYFMEVRGDDLHVCGDGGLALVWVAAANPYAGPDPRPALVIPPHGSGLYYFYPYRSLPNGYPVTTNGRKEYEVDVYDAGGAIGLSPNMPAAHVTTLRQYLRVPFDGNVWRNAITAFNVRWARY